MKIGTESTRTADCGAVPRHGKPRPQVFQAVVERNEWSIDVGSVRIDTTVVETNEITRR